MQELSCFVKAFACQDQGSGRSLGSEFFSKLVGLNFGAAERYPYLLLAVVEANLCGKKVVDGVCRLLTPGMLQQLVAKDARPAVRAAESLMGEARRLVGALQVPEGKRVRLIGTLDARLACFRQ